MRPLLVSDADELAELQRVAFAEEARRFGDPSLPALTQTVAELAREIRASAGIVAIAGTELAGVVRTRETAGTLYVTRLVVAPAHQQRGIGTALMRAAEQQTAAVRACLFVRPRNEAVLAFYRRLGYAPADGATVDADQELVGLTKELCPPHRVGEQSSAYADS
ncbi:GNAT family N-acetyltransferase [Actinopolymorpha cephalotaxi]|uniref:Ribosomal protein S18 acetylase RimI-like enzyme n=1 Tax=Actinopolymorpha cephalotaxi TaxID=504797 RepID=A0ABX2SEK0_9ACTN|nr:GNAT family N-acetyltransferase [Actinopolymorpha cephalotaxi]NYH87358.1 ribosomal protein S18 acetylase RimI-like enzyme [Actinopolymorpha cephalotaxi]